MTWQSVAAFNGVIAAAYMVIFWVILRGLWKNRQVTTNALGLSTALIFFTCAVHHGSHAAHLLAPSLGFDKTQGLAMRGAFGWQMAVWDAVGATVALFYVSLRRSYGRLLHTPELFEDADRRLYDERMARERAALAEAQAITHLGSWEYDLRTNTGTWSDELYEILGLDPASEPDRRAVYDVIVAEDRPASHTAYAAAMASNSPVDATTRIRRKNDDVLRVLHSRGEVARDEDGVPIRFTGTTQDITEAHAAEEARREAEARLRITIDHAPIGVALVDLAAASRGRLISVNAALCDLLGRSADALTGLALGSLMAVDEAPFLRRDLDLLAMDRQARTEAEVRCPRADGELLWVSVAGAAVAREDGLPMYAVFHLMDIGDRKRLEGQLQHLADHDPLTGLFNRRRFEEELDNVLEHTARDGDRGAVLMLDLDGFKDVNDTMGHAYGDEVVTGIGRLIRDTLRASDVLARIGGDEFAVVLNQVGEAEAVAVAEKLLSALREQTIMLGEHRHTRVTGSIGIACFNGSSGLTGEELVAEADVAMYEAKAASKDCLRVFQHERSDPTRIVGRESWLQRLRTAAADGNFELMAQPIVGICAQDIPRFELLLRLRGEHGELVPPATFLYVAERFDLIQRIDRWVFEQAARILHEQHEAGLEISFSVNFSGKTMSDPALIADLSAILDRYPVPAGRLIVEVTETAAIGSLDRARKVASGLHELGCCLALDDFGAGFASFGYLKHVHFDYIKIDGEFVKTITTNATDRLVVQAVVQMSRGLGAQTIAEFVGDDESVECLRELGVDYGQGYHLGHPIPVADALALMPKAR